MGKQSRRKKFKGRNDLHTDWGDMGDPTHHPVVLALQAWMVEASGKISHAEADLIIKRLNLSPRQQFQFNMLIEQAEDLWRRPCLLCGGPPAVIGLWAPSPKLLDYFGVEPDKFRILLYTECEDCLRTDDHGTRVEEAFINEHRMHKAARKANLETEDGVAYFTEPGDMQRFDQALKETPLPD